MKKRMFFLVMALCGALLLTSCAGQNQPPYEEIKNPPTQAVNLGQPVSQPTDAPDYDFDDGSYDPSAEEEQDILGGFIDVPLQQEPEVTSAPTVKGQYAGATPVVIDPIDRPTATPVPPLVFTYQTYDATKLHLSFDGPVGWQADDSASDTYVLTNPATDVDYAATMIVRATGVSGDYSLTDLRREAKQMLDTIKGSYSSFSPSNTADRALMDAKGVYANYKAKLADGTEVAGRIHVTCINKTLYSVHLSYPRAYTDTYVSTVYDTFRHTVKITQ